MIKIQGIIPAIVTPLYTDESINEEALRIQINRQIASNVSAIFCLGTNGEFYAFTYEEKLQIISIVIDEVRGRIPVIVGTGCITTQETITLTNYAQEAGADAVSIIAPYFAEASQAQLHAHFSHVAQHCKIPIILYNIPARTGINIHYQTVVLLAKHKNIVGIKDSSGNFDNTLRYIEETDQEFIVLCGNDSLILWTLLAGGNGGISGVCNLFPEKMVSIYEKYQNSNISKAKEIQDSIRPIRDTFTLGNPNSVIKRALNLLGESVGPARSPFNIESDETDRVIMQALNQLME
ncbi:4-hydroxy-tetrahydrodipicolinate synthase [Gracilibacillus phocaeensis]|uniref:4-hydroxy-tetrahydrodipicolinate synthase n=1 Tax=Gracilibacillus phocaeensis TaxID=2042304 RepID=UPI001032420C|nr:4-hydroxy-tetrahydrodipicolinate synthase [Gracilibacillus phocaeensis]